MVYNSLIAKWMKKYPKNPVKARRLAMKESIAKGGYDPYLQIVVANTKRGYEDVPDAIKQFSGGLWMYHGAMAAYYA